MNQVFFVSDTHFYHKNILEFEAENRPFNDIIEHNEKLIENWNSRVGKRDIVWHLGDVCVGSADTIKIIQELRGDKRLILGNHDKYDIGLYLKYFNAVYAMKKKYSMLLTHIPVHPRELEYKFNYNIHGHLHSKKIDDERYINVSLEHTNLTPISLEEVRGAIR